MPRTIPTTPWGERTSPTSSWSKERENFLLQEDFFQILQEDWNWIYLERQVTSNYTERVKPTSNWI